MPKEQKRGRYPLEVRLYLMAGKGEGRDEKHVATVVIEQGEKVTIHAESEALAKRIDDRLQKPVLAMTGGQEGDVFWDGVVELKRGDPGHAEAVMYEFSDLTPQYELPDENPA